MTKTKKTIVIGAVLAVVISAALYFKNRPDEFFYLGTIEATKVDIPARIASVIETVAVEEGQSVKKDELLVKLSDEEYQLAFTNADGDYRRAERLAKVGSMPKEAFEHLKNRRDEAALKLSWCQIKSPMDGRVLNRYKEVAEWVSPGTKLFTLANLKEVWAMVYVPEKALSQIQLNQNVEVKVGDLQDSRMQARVSRIADEAEFTPKNVQTEEEYSRLVYGIKIMFDNSNFLLKPGMAVLVRLPK